MAPKGPFSATKGYLYFVNIYNILVKKFTGANKYFSLSDKTLFVRALFHFFS